MGQVEVDMREGGEQREQGENEARREEGRGCWIEGWGVG